MYWATLAKTLTFIFCLIPTARGIQETGRKNAFNAPFLWLGVCYFVTGLWLYVNAPSDDVEDKSSQAFLFFLGYGAISVGVSFLKAQMVLGVHSIATVDFEFSQVAVIGALAGSMNYLQVFFVPFFDWVYDSTELGSAGL